VGRDPVVTPLWVTYEFILQCCMVTRGRETKHRTLLNSVLTIPELAGAKSCALCQLSVALEGMLESKRSAEKHEALCYTHFCAEKYLN
jgi:hypothetical protein